MRRVRQKQLRYGLPSGVVAFCAGWALAAILTPDTVFTDYPRWKSTLWIYLGSHFLALSPVHTGGVAGTQPVEMADLPNLIYLVPGLAVASSAAYTCNEINTRRVKQNLSNAIAAGTSYFLTALVAMVVSNIQPGLTFVLTVALAVGAAIWLGSSFLGFFSRGVPIIGIASLGTIAALGLILLLGGLAILTALRGLLAISFGAAAIAGIAVGFTRKLEQRGSRQGAEYPRLHGARLFLEENWKELIVIGGVLIALLFGISGGQ